MPGIVVDGADVLACYRVAREAVDRARSGGGGTLIEAKVTRLTAHSSDDQQTKYRPAEELEEQKALDPLPRFRTQLRDAGVLTDERLEAITADVTATVDEATSYAEAEPDPDPATATWWVYHEDGPADWAPPWKSSGAG
jgi:2-oxoisovalerate dehydrogenase E1 component alpha subunit